MARYIDADKFINWIDIEHLRPADEVCLSENNVVEMINLQPTADVAEVKHGEWDYIATHDCFSCNICKFDSDVVMKYCGGCGAKMDGGKPE